MPSVDAEVLREEHKGIMGHGGSGYSGKKQKKEEAQDRFMARSFTGSLGRIYGFS